MADDKEWWEEFFSGLALRCWRQAIPPEVTRAEVDFIAATLALGPGSRVLDVPCGNGRHAIELADRGMRVTGIDRCAEFIDEARQAALRRGLTQADFTVGDMRELGGQGTFDGAFCFGNSFAYLTREGNAAFLHAVAARLRRGGGFLLQTGAAAESRLPGFDEAAEEHEAGDVTLRSKPSYDILRGLMTVEYEFVPRSGSGRSERRIAEYRIYTVRQICELLHDAGFGGIEIWGGTDRSAFALGDPLLLLAARRL